MLRLKKEIDLQELLKYDFKEHEQNYVLKIKPEKSFNNYFLLVSKDTRELTATIVNDNLEYQIKIDNKLLDYIYKLINKEMIEII